MASLSAADKEAYVPDLRAPPSVTVIQKFFQWMVRNIPGQSDRKLSVQTLKRIFNEFKRVVKYRTEYTYEGHVRDGMNKVNSLRPFLENDLTCIVYRIPCENRRRICRCRSQGTGQLHCHRGPTLLSLGLR